MFTANLLCKVFYKGIPKGIPNFYHFCIKKYNTFVCALSANAYTKILYYCQILKLSFLLYKHWYKHHFGVKKIGLNTAFFRPNNSMRQDLNVCPSPKFVVNSTKTDIAEV